MASPSQQVLPLEKGIPASSRRPVAVATRTSKPQLVRWGSAVAVPPKEEQAHNIKHFTVGPKKPRKTTVWTAEELVRVEQDIRARRGQPEPTSQQDPRVAGEDLSEGGLFARSRIRHAFELFGACMMIAGFLAFAMFA